MPDQHEAVLGADHVVAFVDRASRVGDESTLLRLLRDSLREVCGAQSAVVSRVTARGGDRLLALAHRALLAGAAVREGDLVAVPGGEQGLPAIAAALHPAPHADQMAVVRDLVQVTAALLPGVRALARQAAHSPELVTDAPVEEQVELMCAAARARDRHLVVGLIDAATDPRRASDQVQEQQRTLVQRLHRILRPEDRVWVLGSRVLVAQELPEPNVALLVERMHLAVHAAHAEEGRPRGVVDTWATARSDDGSAAAMLARLEEGLARLAAIRSAGVRCLQGDPQAFAAVDDEPQFLVVVDDHRRIRGMNRYAADALVAAGGDPHLEVGDFTFYQGNGVPVPDDDLLGRGTLRTGMSVQDQVVGIRLRDSSVHWALACVAAVPDEQGKPVAYVMGVSRMASAPDSAGRRLGDAMDLVRQPMVLLTPVLDDDEITDFRIAAVNAMATAMLNAREEDLVGALETEIYPFDTRLGLLLDYAGVVRSRQGTHRVVTLPAGRLAGTYEVSAMPCHSNVLVTAHSMADSHHRAQSARLWDSLTGLNTRHALLEHLRDLEESGRHPVTVVLCDIDDFTGVNDTLGRMRSDRFLIEVARILSEAAGPQDLIARMGSDEFALVSCEISAPGEAKDFAETVRRCLKSGVSVSGAHFTAASSVGVAWAPAGNGVSALLGIADAALAESKALGGDTVTVGHRDRRTPAMRAVAMETDLRDAVTQGQFVLYYQPVVDLTTERIVAAEALIRWRHPQRGMLAPGEFIGVAERRHLITLIGEWVIEQACRQLARWRETLGYTPRLALNTSIGQLVRPGLARTILARTAEAGIDPGALQLEITESQLLHAQADTLANLLACRDIGCELAIDDFGTGHAGFDYLRHIPAQVLKVDKTFVDRVATDTTDAAIVAGVVTLGHGLGLTVVAEGVETVQQARALRTMGCDLGQGWLWYPASPPEDLEQLLRGVSG